MKAFIIALAFAVAGLMFMAGTAAADPPEGNPNFDNAPDSPQCHQNCTGIPASCGINSAPNCPNPQTTNCNSNNPNQMGCPQTSNVCSLGEHVGNPHCTEGETQCPAGTTVVNGVCVPGTSCPAGTTLVNGVCVPPTQCPAGTTLVNGICVTTSTCPAGTTLINGTCVPPVTCPPAMNLVNGICVPPVTIVTPPTTISPPPVIITSPPVVTTAPPVTVAAVVAPPVEQPAVIEAPAPVVEAPAPVAVVPPPVPQPAPVAVVPPPVQQQVAPTQQVAGISIAPPNTGDGGLLPRDNADHEVQAFGLAMMLSTLGLAGAFMLRSARRREE
jgi:hypothetical protein